MKRVILFLSVFLLLFSTLCMKPIIADAYVYRISVSIDTLEYGDEGDTVKSLQSRLAELGYYSGKVDGKYGPLTENAVKKFQKTAGLTVNGTANSITQLFAFNPQAKSNPDHISYSVKYTDNGKYYNIKLSDDKQDYVRSVCKEYDVSFEMVLALMKVESGYKESAKSKTNDYGIMQINKGNHKFLSKKLGVSDFLDFKQNAKAGIYMLSRYTAKHSDVHKVLMCYNLGEGAASKKWKNGIMQSTYSQKVVAAMEQLKVK